MSEVHLERAAKEFAEATVKPPYLYDLGHQKGRETVDKVQSSPIDKPDVDIQEIRVPGGPPGTVSVRILRPKGSKGSFPAILYMPGAGWVFANPHAPDRLVRVLA